MNYNILVLTYQFRYDTSIIVDKPAAAPSALPHVASAVPANILWMCGHACEDVAWRDR